ncbi:MAG: hypothetical protein Kow0065_10370 [Methylomicrobium sp.]
MFDENQRGAMNIVEISDVKAQCERLLFDLIPDNSKKSDSLMSSNRRYRQAVDLVSEAAQALGAAAINLKHIDAVETEI